MESPEALHAGRDLESGRKQEGRFPGHSAWEGAGGLAGEGELGLKQVWATRSRMTVQGVP